MPTSTEELKKFKPFDFQYWVVNELRGTPSQKKVGDMGIDGLSFYHHYPIQVKQSDSVGRNVVDNFETALRRYYKERTGNFIGFIVAFSFTKGAHEEVARAKKDGFKLELVTVQRLLDKKFTIAQEGELFAGCFKQGREYNMSEKQKPQPNIVEIAARMLRDPKSVRLTPELKRRIGARILDDQKNDPQKHKATPKPKKPG